MFAQDAENSSDSGSGSVHTPVIMAKVVKVNDPGADYDVENCTKF